jgi:cytochrome c
MRKYFAAVIVIFAFLLITAAALPALSEEHATPDEVVAKVKEASAFLIEAGDAGLAEFCDPNGRWVFKDTYVFVYDCDKGECVGNITPGLVGKKIEDVIDVNGKPVGLELCEASKKPNGWWIEYIWPVKGTGALATKISYIYKAPGSKYTVCAGIYSPEGVTADQLNEKLK